MVRHDKTLLRAIDDVQIAHLSLQGRTLVIGDIADIDYTRLIQIDGNLVSINITAAVNPAIVANMNEIYPIADDTYDNVICFNAPYHTGTAKGAQAGERLVVTVPPVSAEWPLC